MGREEEHFFSYFEQAATRLCRRSDDDNLTKSENSEVKQGQSPTNSAHEKNRRKSDFSYEFKLTNVGEREGGGGRERGGVCR